MSTRVVDASTVPVTRRHFLKAGTVAGTALLVLRLDGGQQALGAPGRLPVRRRLRGAQRALAVPVPGGTLDPVTIPKYKAPIVIPPAMPQATIDGLCDKHGEYYEIAVRQFQQQILPQGMPATTVWSYGSIKHPGTVAEGGTFNYPAFTIEAKANQMLTVNWINDLVDADGNFLPHLFPVDQTLHWANPPGPRDTPGTSQEPYRGPVPVITHVHGAHTFQESDGYPEAWYLPDANNIPASIQYRTGTFYEPFRASSPVGRAWKRGAAVFQYPNDQRATTIWYHDHSLGMTRQNVYAGPAGFFLIRGGPGDVVRTTSGGPAVLPGPAPKVGDKAGTKYYEIPIVIQDRSFNADGSLFYPDNRAFFEGLDKAQLQIPFIPDPACNGQASDVPPIWNPEFFANVMVANGVAWPFLDVEPRRYRLRLLNGCNSRFLILKFDHPDVEVWQIGADGGFLAAPVNVKTVSGGSMLLAPAERADLIVDFSKVPDGTDLLMINQGPDEPFGGGVPGVDFPLPDANTTAQVMQFRVRKPAGDVQPDPSTPPAELVLPPIPPTTPNLNPRPLALKEVNSSSVLVPQDPPGDVMLACDDPTAVPFGPTAVLLGTLNPDGTPNPLLWGAPVTENVVDGTTETWELYNFTVDSHPIHIHLVQFQVVNRETFAGVVRPPEPSETGFKDTVVVFPNEITRVQARFDRPGRFVWHCHILEHEDNEMMRPYNVLPAPNGGNRPPVICVRRRCGLLQRWSSRRRGRRRCR